MMWMIVYQAYWYASFLAMVLASFRKAVARRESIEKLPLLLKGAGAIYDVM